MSIVVPSAASSLSCFAPRAGPTKRSPALAAIIALNEYCPVFPLFLRAVKGHPPRLEEVPRVAHALPRVVRAARFDPLARKCQEPKQR
jgi:hypothetical protein